MALANIEVIRWSIIDPKTKFTSSLFDIREIMDFRKANMKTTNMLWITCQPVMDRAANLYNPKALIMVILN